jgi:hypothetical protein
MRFKSDIWEFYAREISSRNGSSEYIFLLIALYPF